MERFVGEVSLYIYIIAPLPPHTHTPLDPPMLTDIYWLYFVFTYLYKITYYLVPFIIIAIVANSIFETSKLFFFFLLHATTIISTIAKLLTVGLVCTGFTS